MAKPVSAIRLAPEIENLIQKEMESTGKTRTAIYHDALAAYYERTGALPANAQLAFDLLRKLKAEMSKDSTGDETANRN